jgi:hypothetical protein
MPYFPSSTEIVFHALTCSCSCRSGSIVVSVATIEDQTRATMFRVLLWTTIMLATLIHCVTPIVVTAVMQNSKVLKCLNSDLLSAPGWIRHDEPPQASAKSYPDRHICLKAFCLVLLCRSTGRPCIYRRDICEPAMDSLSPGISNEGPTTSCAHSDSITQRVGSKAITCHQR